MKIPPDALTLPGQSGNIYYKYNGMKMRQSENQYPSVCLSKNRCPVRSRRAKSGEFRSPAAGQKGFCVGCAGFDRYIDRVCQHLYAAFFAKSKVVPRSMTVPVRSVLGSGSFFIFQNMPSNPKLQPQPSPLFCKLSRHGKGD
jgi:hypothetical protein